MKFSIITPFHCWHSMKEHQINRCLDSVFTNSFRNYEHILIDDGSVLEYNLNEYDRIKLIRVRHLERLMAYKKGLEEADGDWIVFCDSDDELLSYSLYCMNQAIKKYPGYKVFNFSSIHIGRNYQSRIRECFRPAEKGDGHEVFGGGCIVNGTFIFHKSLIDKEMLDGLNYSNPWDFSINFQNRFPEIKPYFTATHPDHPKGLPRELGNPWGNDYYLFYQITRHNKSKALNIPIIMIHHEGKQEGEYHELLD